MKNSEFIRGKAPITKEEVRAIALAKLELEDKETFLDIGAGTGSMSIEAAKHYPHLHVIAIESQEEAQALVRANREKFTLSNLKVIPRKAPCGEIGKVESVFIGGTGGDGVSVIKWAYDLLIEGGTLVMNFLLLENFHQALRTLEQIGLESIDVSMIQVSKLENLGRGTYFKPHNSVYMIAGKKGRRHE
ncbi:MAG: decarboxylating cobalt-precorrin-6B (C(15))-methyltransferase [Cellulosilyticaceae bacterium]